MKRRILGTILGISMFLMAGCQPTPDGPIVVNKNDGTMEEKIAASPLPAQKYEAPETAEDKFENAKGTITITVNAEVTVPDLEEYPVAAVRPKQYTQEFVNNLVGYFRKNDEPLFYVDRSVPLKEHIEAQYEQAQEQLEWAEQRGDTEDIERAMLDLKRLEQEMKDAPEENEVTPTDLTLKEDEHGIEKVGADCVLSNGQYLMFEIYNGKSSSGMNVSLVADENMALGADTHEAGYTSGDKEKDVEAQKQAEAFVAGLGLEGYQCTEVFPGKVSRGINASYELIDTIWVFSFSYCYPEEPMQTPREFIVHSEDWGQQEAEYSPLWRTEYMYVYVDETGVIGIEAQNAAEVTEELNANVYLMPFEDIYEKIDTYIYLNQSVWGGTVEHRVLVKEIRLSYMRVMRKDHPESYLLIPVWDIIGNVAIVMKEWTNTDNKDVSFATINALDGSLISRQRMY